MAMQVVTEEFVKNKKVLLRYDIDVALRLSLDKLGIAQGHDPIIEEDFKLRAGLDTLKLCLENASKVIIIGHLGRPFKTVEDEKKGNPPELSAKPIQQWLQNELGQDVEFALSLEQASKSSSKLILLENIRFFHGEVPGLEYHTTCTSKTCDIDFAHRLSALGDVYVNEAFSSYNPAASTTMLPALLPHAAGLRFAQEVEVLTGVRNPPAGPAPDGAGGPKKPFLVVMGGAKVADKLPVITALAEKADAVLVGGKLVQELRAGPALPRNVLVGKLNKEGTDIAPETVESWSKLIMQAKMIVWNGPVGKFEAPKNDQTEKVAQMILDSGAEIVVGGGDTIAALSQANLLQKAQEKAFVSVGGGAMLKFLSDGTLPTIEALG